jgi:hypothetical protein
LKNLRAHKKAIEGGKWDERQRKSEPIILPYENEPEVELASGSGRREAESAPLVILIFKMNDHFDWTGNTNKMFNWERNGISEG